MGMQMGGDLFKRGSVWVCRWEGNCSRRELYGYADWRKIVQEGNCMGMLMGGELFKRGIVWVC